LFAPPFTTTDEELGEMVSRFVDTVRHVAGEVQPALERAPEPVGGPR
jgi:hypothetical protein